MYATHPDLRRVLAAAIIALALALLALMALPAAVGELEIALDAGAGSSPAPAAEPTAPAEPAWVRDPLASPLTELRSPSCSREPPRRSRAAGTAPRRRDPRPVTG